MTDNFVVPDKDELPTTPPTLWVDTNIMLDFYTHIRFWDNQVGGDIAMEESRMIMQRAAWLAMALDEQRAVTKSFSTRWN